jgi:hypothetical protein
MKAVKSFHAPFAFHIAAPGDGRAPGFLHELRGELAEPRLKIFHSACCFLRGAFYSSLRLNSPK